MLRKIKRAIFLVCAVVTSSLSQEVPEFRSNVDLVAVPVTVVDAMGVGVRNLTRDDFRIYDNEIRRRVESLWIDDNLPLTVGVIIDGSESQKEQVSEHRETAIELLERILTTGDRAFVVSVDEDVRLWADLTSRIGDLRRLLAGSPGELFGEPCEKRASSATGLRPVSTCGSSPLWDAVHSAVQLRLQSSVGNRALLILTDGFDSGSSHSWQQAADAATRTDTTVYAIQYRSGFARRFAPDLYKLIAQAGGTRFGPPNGEYGPVLDRLQTHLRRRYILGFRPERVIDGFRHNIRVEVTRPDLTVRARRVYFQEP